MGMGYKASDFVSEAAEDSNLRCMVSLMDNTSGTGEPKLGGRVAFMFVLLFLFVDDGCVVVITAVFVLIARVLFPF